MLKVEHLIKEKVSSEVVKPLEKEQHTEQVVKAWKQVSNKEDNKGLKRLIEDVFFDQEPLFVQEKKYKRLKRSDDQQPGSSSQGRRLNPKQQEQSEYDTVTSRLEEFTMYFVKEFETKLHAYYMITEGEAKKVGKFSDTFSGKVGQGIGAIVGGIIGSFVVSSGGSVMGARLGATAGEKLVEELGSKLGKKYHEGKIAKLLDLVLNYEKNKADVRELLVKAGFDIFQSFEMQFMRATTNLGPQKAMQKLAQDAVNRAIEYYKQKEEAFITKAVTLGRSKIESVWGIPVPFGKTPGFEVKYKYGSSEKEWITASLYEKVGLVIKGKTPMEVSKYYKKKSGESRTAKYGYRRLFVWESWDQLEKKYELDSIVKSESGQFTDYRYTLDLTDLEEKSKSILEKINSDDNSLAEERIKEVIKEVKNDIIEGVKALIRQSHEEDNRSLTNMEANLKNLKVDEYLEQFKLYFEEAKKERQKIAKFIEASLEKQDIHHDDNKREHKKTQEVIERVEVRVKGSDKKIDKIYEAVVPQENKQTKESIWFDVKEPVKSFTALSLGGKGRQDKLDQVAANIQQEMVLISGLPGMGKSELAIKYARSHYGQEDSVVWINAETSGTIKESLRRLATEELRIPIREEIENQMQDRDIRSVVKDVYKYFSKSKSLFIFDNAEKYDAVKEFLPLDLPAGTNKPNVLITSNNLEWESARASIKKLVLEDFDDKEAMAFVKDALGIESDLQNEDIANLAKKLHNFPLALHQAVAYIKEEGKKLKNIDPENEFKINDYLKEYEEKTKDLLKSKVLQKIGNDYGKTTFTALQIALDKVKNSEEYGQQALEIINIIAYFASNDIPVKIFLELISSNERELGAVIELLKQYSVVRQEGQLNVHGLVQQVRRLELEEQKEEEKTLEKALGLLRKQIVDRNSAESYTSHIISVWDHASKYNRLIEEFIVRTGATYFHLIAEGSKYETVSTIVNEIESNDSNKLKKIINAKNKDRGNPLHGAAENGKEQTVNLLISKGADINVKKKYGWTPLSLAANNGHLKVVEDLLNSGAEIDTQRTGNGFTPLHLASKNGYSEIVKLLLDKGADVNAQDKRKYTPLHFAVKNNHFEVVQVLLKDEKINVNVETEHKLTPLQFATKNGNLDIVEALLAENADVNAQNNDGFTSLHFAVWGGDERIVSSLLKRSGIKIDEKTTKGNTPLHLAAEKGSLKVIKALIAKNADVNIRNEEGKIASDLANEAEVKNYIIQHQNKEEVLISQVEQDQQPTFNKRKGTSGMGGQLYEIELLMLFLLQGVKQKEDKKIDSFYLATNMEEAGDFDDVVFKYNENGGERSKVVFLQAKHKETEKNEKEAKEKKITIDTLLSKSEKGDFVLRKYLSSYRKIKQLRLKEDHLIFKDGVENCDFVIYTNAVFNFDKSKDGIEKAYIEKKYIESGDILNLKGSSQEYYKLNAEEKVMDALRHSLDYEILVRELAQSIFSGSIDGNKSIFKDYQISLAERVIEKKNQREGKLREEFLDDEQEFSSALFEEIKKKKEFANKSVNELKEELKRKNIQLPSNFGSAEENDLKLPLPSKLFSDEEIKEFLSELKLFVSQPNEGRLGKIIKGEIQEVYKVEQQDIDSVFSDVKNKVERWWKGSDEDKKGKGKYLTKDNRFFQESARVSINFDVKEPVALFTGRRKELSDLHSRIQRSSERVTVVSQMTSISGLGGIGKTELSRQYIHENSKDYDNNIIWINAESEATLIESFNRLAKDKLRINTQDANGKEKDIKSVVEEVYKFFSKRESLFIFDNAEKNEYLNKFLPLRSSIPDSKKPYILITSRNREWEKGIEVIDLSELKLEDAIEFVKKGLGIEDESQDQEIKALVEKLQRFPLAIQQAIAYIEDQRVTGEFSIDDYLEEYEKKTKDLLDSEVFKGIDNDYARTTFTTWKITIDKIASDKEHGELALKILNTVAYFAPENINREMFLDFARSDEGKLKGSVRLLVKYSMVNGEEKQSVLSIHRLVQEVTRLELKGHGKEKESLKEALKLVEASLSKENLDHAVSAWNHASKHKELVKEFSNLSGQIINKLNDAIRYEEACLFGVRALEPLKNVLGPDHADTLKAQHSVAEALNNLGRYNEALKAYQEIFDIQKVILGLGSPDTLTTKNNIAVVLKNQGEYDEALKIYAEILDIQKDILGSDHPDTLRTRHNMAGVFLNQGRYEKALEVYTEVFYKRKTILGPNNPFTLGTLMGIIAVLYKQGKYMEALEAYKEVFDIQKDTLGLQHPTTLLTQHNIAGILDTQGRYEEALRAYIEVFDKRKVILGSEHPDTLSTQHNMAGLFDVQGKYEQALKVYQEVLDKRIRIFGPGHPSTLNTRNDIAKVLDNQGKYEEALKEYQDVLDKRTKVLGLDHPSTLSTRNGIARVLDNQGKYEEALKEYQDVLGKRTQILNLDNPFTLNTRNGIAEVLEKQGKNEDALEIFEEVYEKRKEKLGKDHPDTLTTRNGIAKVLEKQGKNNEALKIFEEVYEKRKEKLRDHPDTLKIKENIDRIQAILGKEFNILINDKKADFTLKDNDDMTPLHKAAENGKKEVLNALLDSIKEEQRSVSLEECLPSTSSGRRKREAKIGECEFSWEDVDEFNAEKDEKRDFGKIKIDSEKFVNYIKDLPEEKRDQLIQLADETGNAQGLVSKLVDNQKVMNHLSKMGRVSGMTMHGMMAKNVLADFLNGDYQGVAINVGFIAGGQGFAKVAEAASLKGLKLASEGRLLLGKSLRAASPFLARGTSAFVVYDLVNQIKAFKNGTEEALVSVVGDSIYLGVDAAEIGVEVAEAFGALEGVSSVTGPIGATIGAVVFVGTDIYMAVKRVDKIDQIIHLTGNEKFVEGLRALIGIKPEQYIEELMEKKQLYNQLVKQGLEYLKQHSDIQSYVFPTGQSVVDSCRKVPYQVSDCASGGFGGGCLRGSTVTRYAEECTTKFKVDLDNKVILDRKRTDIKWSRARPDDPSNGKLFCLPRGNDEPVSSYGSYLCENAIGLSTEKKENYTLIDLGKGDDYSKGFLNSPNIFVVGNGFKRYYGGNKDDIFILQGDFIEGYINGGGGVDTVDLGKFASEVRSIQARLGRSGYIYYTNNNSSFGMENINRISGRKNKSDIIICDYNTKYVDGQGGENDANPDVITIPSNPYFHEMHLIVRSSTSIVNHANIGSFNYTIIPERGKAQVSITLPSLLIGLPTDKHNFFFNSTISDLVGIYIQNVSQISDHTVKSATFSFLSTSNKLKSVFDSKLDERRFNITISDIPVNASYALSNGAEIKIGNKGNMYMLENTNKSPEEIIKNYLPIANRLNKMSFFIQSLLSNETVVIGSGNHEVIYNNPVYRSHLVGNGGENVYVIDSEADNVPEVIIHDIDEENSIDTIDLRNVVKKARGSFELQVIKSENDLLLRATVEKHEYFTVRLKDGVERYNKTHVIVENAPMRISVDENEWSLKPQPLMFEKDKEVIVVTNQDVEKGTQLVIPRKGGNYTFVRSSGNDLIITNAFDSSITKDDLCTITLSKFYETPKMATLSIKFADKEIMLKDHEKEISAARNVEIIKREYKDQVYGDVFNHKRNVELLNAVKESNLNKVKELINQGANVNAQDEDIYGKKPVHVAAENNNKNILKFLLSKGAKVTDTDRMGNTPLHYAAWRGCIEAAKFLINKGANINPEDTSTLGKKPIHVAVENNNKNIVEFLLSKGVSVDETDRNEWTPLHWAASKGCLEVAKFLIEKGADINAENVYGKKPIHRAAENNNENIIELLLSKGVSVNDIDKDGTTPLYWASWSGNLDIVKYLIGKGADINAKDKNGKTPLDVAKERGHNSIVECLEEKLKGERPAQRKRRHHHGDHNHHHLLQTPFAIDQPEIAASSSTRPSSWINDLFGWVKSSVGRFRAALPETSANYSNEAKNPSNQYTSQFDSEVCISNNVGLGFFLLQSFLDKKYPLPKFCSVTPEEVLANTLNIVEEFEKIFEKTAKQSDVLVKDVNFFKIYLDIAGHVRNERYSQIPNTLYSAAKEACPKDEKFLSILKGNIEKMLDGQQIVNNRNGSNQMQNTIGTSDKMPLSSLNRIAIEPLNGKKGVTCAGRVA